MTYYLSEAAVLALYQKLIGTPILRSPEGFASAVNLPRSSAFGEDAYRTVLDEAAALMLFLAQNQTFLDGNKRIAWIAGNVFLDLNGYEVEVGPTQINHLFCISLSKEHWSIEQISEWLSSYLIRTPD